MLSVGITGGIGSGKTFVCKIFESLGVPVYYADERAREILAHHPVAIQRVKALLGEEAYDANGIPNRKWIAAQVFNHPDQLAALNAIIHPLVFEDHADWLKTHQHFPYVLKEAALLVETGSYRMLDKLIVVAAPEDLRIRRVMQRDGVSREEVEVRMRNQLPEEEKLQLADYVIENVSEASTRSRVAHIHAQLLKLVP